jgi:hypothetical protein
MRVNRCSILLKIAEKLATNSPSKISIIGLAGYSAERLTRGTMGYGEVGLWEVIAIAPG